MKLKAEPQTAYLLPTLDLTSTVASRREAFKELDAALSAVRRARQGFDDLKAKASELEHRADAIEREIATAGGAEAVARAMGLAGTAMGMNADAPASHPINVKALADELTAVRDELRSTLAAIAAAPALFPALTERLDEAKHVAVAAHQLVRETADRWATAARAIAARITDDIAFVDDYLIAHNRRGVALPEPFESLDAGELQRLASERAAIEAARAEGKPLVAEAKPVLVADASDDWARRQSAINAENERRWRAERAAREAREQEEARAAAEAKREAKRQVAAARVGSAG